MKIEFGMTVFDIISGFKGVVTGFAQYITGCSQYLVTPKADEKGEFKEAHWFDEDRLEIEDTMPQFKLDSPSRMPRQVRAVGPDKPAPVK